tara:strand:- start:358 stop:621 length:264 start_codon:yes stop_codon:yes gene_type:complete
MDRLQKWMDLLSMKYKHQQYIITWLSNFAQKKQFHKCCEDMIGLLVLDPEPHSNIIDLIDQIRALHAIDLAIGGLDYEDVLQYNHKQ